MRFYIAAVGGSNGYVLCLIARQVSTLRLSKLQCAYRGKQDSKLPMLETTRRQQRLLPCRKNH